MNVPGLSAPAIDGFDLRAAPRTGKTGAEQARQTGIAFEQMFLAQMLQPVFDSIGSDGPFGGGQGERMFRSFQVDEYAKAITRSGGIGIADAVARHLISLLENSNG
jgi:flagellar protein FlgJ